MSIPAAHDRTAPPCIAQFRAGAQGVPAHHAIADAEIRYAEANSNDNTRSLAARNERWLGAELILPRQHQHIDILHAACLDPDL
jgi:hypothetical protein